MKTDILSFHPSTIAAIVLFLCVVYIFCKIWREGRKPIPDDLLYALKLKIENYPLTDPNELKIIKLIKKLRLRSDIDQKKLDMLNIQFRQRFQELHQTDETD